MFAIGQLTDQASWLTLSVNKSLLGLAGARVVRRSACRSRPATAHAASGCRVTAAAEGLDGHRQGAVLRVVRPAGRRVGQRGELVGFHRLGRGRAADQGLLRVLVRRPREGDLRAARAAGAELPPGQPRGADRDAVVAARRHLPRRAGARHAAARDDAGPVGAAASAPERSSRAPPPRPPLATTPLGDPTARCIPIAELRALPADADRGVRAGPRWRRSASTRPSRSNFAVAVGNETTVVPSTGSGRRAAGGDARPRRTSSARPTRSPRSASGGAPASDRTPVCGPTCSLPPTARSAGSTTCWTTPTSGVTFASDVRFRWDADVIIDNAHRSRAGCWSMPTRRTRSSPATRRPTRACSPTDPSFPCCSGKRTLDVARARLRRPCRSACALPWCSASATARARCAGCCRARPSWRGRRSAGRRAGRPRADRPARPIWPSAS